MKEKRAARMRTRRIFFFVQEKQELIRPVIDVSFTGLPDLTGNFRSRRHQAPESAALSMRKYIWK